MKHLRRLDQASSNLELRRLRPFHLQPQTQLVTLAQGHSGSPSTVAITALFVIYNLFKSPWCRAGGRNTFTFCHYEKAVNIHKAKYVNEAICHWQQRDGDALLKTRRPVVLVDATICLSIEFERGRSRKSDFDAPRARGRRDGDDFLSPAATQGWYLCRWTLLSLLQTSQKKRIWRFRAQACASLWLILPSLQKGIFFKLLASPNSQPVLLFHGRKKQKLPPPNHYSLINFSQPGVIMHGPVSGYLCMLQVYLIISVCAGG